MWVGKLLVQKYIIFKFEPEIKLADVLHFLIWALLLDEIISTFYFDMIYDVDVPITFRLILDFVGLSSKLEYCYAVSLTFDREEYTHTLLEQTDKT